MVEELGTDNYTKLISMNESMCDVMASMLELAIWETPYSNWMEYAARQGRKARYCLVPVS